MISLARRAILVEEEGIPGAYYLLVRALVSDSLKIKA
jgi:hypothetical protein